MVILRITEKEIEKVLHTPFRNKKMVDGETSAPQPPPVVPPVQPVVLPAAPVQPVVSPAQPGPLPELNWSYLKPEFAGKPDEDADAHLLRTNDWMDTHAFQEGVKF